MKILKLLPEMIIHIKYEYYSLDDRGVLTAPFSKPLPRLKLDLSTQQVTPHLIKI